MGVKGLWKILEPASRTVNSPEALAGQRVAIDASIWIYQFIRALPPSTTSAYSSLVLAGLFNRLCKLIYFNIKPVMIFDGLAPAIKKRTTRERAERQGAAEERYRRLARKMIAIQIHLQSLQHNTTLREKKKLEDNTFEALDDAVSVKSKVEDREAWQESEGCDHQDIDIYSHEFTRLPIEVKQEVLLAKKESALREHFSLVRGDEQSIAALDFSKLQVEALVKRRRIAAQLEKVNEGAIVNYEQDYIQRVQPEYAKRIASEASRRYALIKNKNGGWIIDGSNQSTENAEPLLEGLKDTQNIMEPKEYKDEDEDEDLLLFGKSTPEYSTPPRDPILDTLIKLQKDEKPKEEAFTFDPVLYLKSVESATPIEIEIEAKEKNNISASIPFENADFDFAVQDYKEKDKDKIVGELPASRSQNEISSTEHIPIGQNNLSESESSKEQQDCQIELESNSDESILEGVLQEQISHPSVNTELIERLQAEVEALRKGSNPSHSNKIDNELLEDFRALLTIMGIPWIIAPGEAEAQCAHLQKAGHVDAVISDDNDTLVFGGERVYRHFFTSQKRIELFLMGDLIRELGLGVEEMRILSVLLGSDYAIGVRGIGPVKALQLFRTLKGTEEGFTLDVISDGLLTGTWPTVNDPDKENFLKKLSLQCAITDSASSLDPLVIEQYRHPILDTTIPNFRWKLLPDLTRLTLFLQTKLHWTLEQCKKTIGPLVERQLYHSRNKQSNLDSFIIK